MTVAKKQVNVEYEKKLHEYVQQTQDTIKDRENIEKQIIKSEKENKIINTELIETEEMLKKQKAELEKFKTINNFDEKAKQEEIKKLNRDLRLINEKKEKLLKQSNAVVSYNTTRFEKTCNELQEKIKRSDIQISQLKTELSELNKKISDVKNPNPIAATVLTQKIYEEVKLDPIKEKYIKEENAELQFTFERILKEYEEAKHAWDEENKNIKSETENLEQQTVWTKVQAANAASELDNLLSMYEQCSEELASYGKQAKVKFKIQDLLENLPLGADKFKAFLNSK